ncbi:MAG: hypothetical protein IKQ69_10775 [Oscillospiraceae bacterium]|nr:hypothetical protein [Oscillospiraceae bacterium]MBR6209467.1 hypothetical protein [Oscillospiraceae bacterium]
MKILEMRELLAARTYACPDRTREDVAAAAASDMLSDVLAMGGAPDVLITGLLNPQVIRTAVLMDARCVVFVRGKVPGPAIVELAEESGVCVLGTDMPMYQVCGVLHAHGLAAAR